jgi:hypothetical protein
MNRRCTRERIDGFPTWEFASGERSGGVKSPRALAAATGCPID